MTPHVLTIAIATLLVGWLMTTAGLQKSALELKRRRRICPSCGRYIENRVCSSCTRVAT
jgi:recombinational DNA repair protein RecR